MSIVLKANELNTLIYKYLLQSGLSHTAYTLFNQANLSQPLQQFRFDVKAGHLLALLQKSLIYSQIESHVSMSQYMECLEPFHLLKPHTCKITQKVRKEKEELIKDLDSKLTDSIKRTNSIYNAAVANRNYDDIVYEAKGNKYFQKFAKIRLPASESENELINRYKVEGTGTQTLLYNSEDSEIDLLKYDTLNEQVIIERIFPCVRQGQFEKAIVFTITYDYIIQIFEGNHITLFNVAQEELNPIQFNLPVRGQITHIQPNNNIQQLVCFKNENQFLIINLKSLMIIKMGQGNFFWRGFDEYLVINKEQIQHRSLRSESVMMTYKSQDEFQDILLNTDKNLFAAISKLNKLIHIYTFQSTEPLFVFNLEQQKCLKQVLWITSNCVDYICWLTQQNISVFDISLNSYSKIIEIQQYDEVVSMIYPIRKEQKEQVYLIGLGVDNLILYDVTNAKIQRVETEGKVLSLKALSLQRVVMITDSTIYFLSGQYIDPLFK